MSVPRPLAYVLGAAALLALLPAPASAGGGPPAPPPKGPPVAKPPPATSGSIRGTILGPGGKPFGGAQVVAMRQDAQGSFSATTDARGVFTITGVPAGKAFVLVRAPRHVTVRRNVDVRSGAAVAVDHTLEPGVRFAGKVTDVRGAPVAGATIEASHQGHVPSPTAFSFAEGAQSRADGSFEVDGLAPGDRYDLRVEHPRFARVVLPGLPAEAGSGHGDLDVMMEDASWLRGVVVDPAGKPVTVARVGLLDESSGGMPGWFRRMLIGAGVSVTIFMGGDGGEPVAKDGGFHIGSLTETEVEVWAIADGYFRTRWKVDDLEPGKGKEGLKITLEPATAWIEGKVVGADGKPIPKATISAQGDEGEAGTATTDAQGRFRLAKVRSRTPVHLTATAEGRAKQKVPDVELNSGGHSITLQVAPRLKVKVLDEKGKVVPEVTLWIQVGRGRHQESEMMSLEQGADGLDVPVPLGDLRVQAIGPKGLRVKVGEWTTEPGATVEAGTIRLVKGAKPEPEPEEDGEDEEE